jgi:hypothetical protein
MRVTSPPYHRGMAASGPLSTLVSQTLVAFTIETDNEFEAAMPHRTAASRAAGEPPHGPWLVSLAMWFNFLRHVDEEGVTLRELERRTGVTKIATAGMERWSYVTLIDGVLRPTRAGRAARRIWSPLPGLVEDRWRGRFGADAVAALRASLAAALAPIDDALPDYPPTLGYGLWTAENVAKPRTRPASADASEPPLPVLLSRLLVAIALEVEPASNLAMALGGNVVRVIDEDGVPVRDLPTLTGISKEAVAVSLGYLDKRALATTTTEKGSKVARLTTRGARVRAEYDRILEAVESRLSAPELRSALEAILSQHDALASGLTPHPDGWRARRPYLAQTEALLRDPRTALPCFPVVTHRGGYPDGS